MFYWASVKTSYIILALSLSFSPVFAQTITNTTPGASDLGMVTRNIPSGTQPVSGPLTDTQLRATPVPISGTVTVTDGAGALNVIVDSSALPTGAATSANQDGIVRDGTGDTTQANVSTGRLHVDGSGVTQPVSGTVSANASQTGTWTVQPGNTANTTPWLATIGQGGNTAAVNASSQLSVNCANCSGSGVSHQDKAVFTPSTTNMVPVGGYRDDTAPSTVAEGEAAAARLTENRAIHVNLRDAAGAELAVGGGTQYDQGTVATDTDKQTQAGAVRRDTAAVATGVIDGDRVGLSTDSVGRLRVTSVDTTQPVSGTVTANAGSGTFTVGGTVTANAGTGTLAVSGPLTDTQLRATAVPISGTVTVTDGAGALNVIVDSGTTTVTQATATNLNAAVVGTGTAGSPAGNILTIQGVASMTKLLVTPDSVALPANQSVNVSQINAVTPSMGLGVSDTGTQRVALSRENACADVTNLTTVAIDTAASGNTQLVALSGTTRIYVCDFGFMVQGTNLVRFIYGTGTACATGQTNLTGQFGGLAQTGVSGRLLTTPSAQALCINNSAATAVGGWITHRQF